MTPEEKIVHYVRLHKSLHRLVTMVSNELGNVLEPLLRNATVEELENLRELVDTPCYWQYELIRRIKHMKEAV